MIFHSFLTGRQLEEGVRSAGQREAVGEGRGKMETPSAPAITLFNTCCGAIPEASGKIQQQLQSFSPRITTKKHTHKTKNPMQTVPPTGIKTRSSPCVTCASQMPYKPLGPTFLPSLRDIRPTNTHTQKRVALFDIVPFYRTAPRIN